MKKAIVLLLAAGAIGSAVAQPSVGVSIGINQPGVYGRINIGDYPRPAVVLPEPVIIEPAPRYTERQPIYLYVPPEHQRDWRRYCGRYNACGQPVYFVQDQWVRERYAQEHRERDRGDRREWDRDGRYETQMDERQDREHGRDRGQGREYQHERDHEHDGDRRD